MKQPLRIAAYICCTLQIICAVFVITQAYNSRDIIMAILLIIPAALAIFALCGGPDREERKLREQVSKARLRRELQELEGSKV